MPAQTKISKTLINAYYTAHYRVKGPPAFTLRIRKKSPELAKLYETYQVTSAMYITAYNPYGKKTDRNTNMRNHKRLLGELTRQGLTCMEGVGGDPSGHWVAEPSLLVLGVTQDFAREKAVEYHQNAVVWADSDAVPELILTR